MTLSVVMPLFNEEATLEKIVAAVESVELPPPMERIELIMVDDCSTDRTREILKDYEQRHKVMYHETKRGKGKALQTGFRAATGDLVVVQYADLKYDPNDYGKLLMPIIEGNADVVYGSRFVGGDSRRVLYTRHRVGNTLLTRFSNVMSTLELTDIKTRFKLFKRSILDRITIQEDRSGIESEITAKVAEMARTEGVRVYEVGISYHGSASKGGKRAGLSDAFRSFYCVLKYNTTNRALFTRYGLMGIFVVLGQLLAIIGLVEFAEMEGVAGENIANIISIEVSILIGYFVHSRVTWQVGHKELQWSKWKHLRAFMSFHGATFLSVAVRIVLFYLLSLTGMVYQLNAVIGIIVAIMLNFFGYDRLVFNQ